MTLVTASPRLVARAALGAGLVLALFVAAAPALAHAELVSADPAPDSIVATVPAQVSATFDDELDGTKSSIVVIGPDGSTVGQGSVSATDTRTMTATITPAGAGPYEVRWTSVATDGDVLRATYTFTVGGGGGSPSASAAESPAASGQPGPAGSAGTDLSVLIAAAVAGLALGAGIAWWRRRQGQA